MVNLTSTCEIVNHGPLVPRPLVKDMYNPLPRLAALPCRAGVGSFVGSHKELLMPATGKITQVIGSTFDAEFPEDQLPKIYNAVRIDSSGPRVTVHPPHRRSAAAPRRRAGPAPWRWVRTDGLRRGMDCVDTGAAVTVPVGKETLGRVFNLLGDPIDNRGPVNADAAPPDSPRAAGISSISTPKAEVFETGIKVIDLLTPFLRGGKAGSVRRGGPRQDRRHSGTHRPHRPAARRLFRLRRRRRTHPRRQPTSGWKCRKPRSATPANTSSTRPSWSSAR